MKTELVKGTAQKTKHPPGKKGKGQEVAQRRLLEFMLNGRTGKPDNGLMPSPLFGCSEKE
jgi:hypothetical protein